VSPPAVRLGEPVLQTIRRLAGAAYPHEGCGVLIGAYAAGGEILVEVATSGRNLWTERMRDRYDLDPADIAAAERQARAGGRDVVGFWHSHPDHPAQPSRFDTDRAWVDYAYLIVTTTREGSGDLNGFRLEGEGQPFEQVPLLVGEGVR
jgi:proteasome lid subunit RPN8/RPN11